jgi:hypothetical protein
MALTTLPCATALACDLDLKEMLTLLLLPSLLFSPVIGVGIEEDGVKRKASWRPSNSEMMQGCVMPVPVRMMKSAYFAKR